jgi:hypothetical protein
MKTYYYPTLSYLFDPLDTLRSFGILLNSKLMFKLCVCKGQELQSH